MNSKLSVLRVGLTGLIGVGLLSACSDRMGSFKANRVSCEKYNEWARKTNNDLACQAAPTNKNGMPVAEEEADVIPEEMKAPVQGNANFAEGKAPQAEAAAPKVVEGASEQRASGPYARTDWQARFEELIQHKSEAANYLVQGLTVSSGLDDNGQSVFDIKALVRFKAQLMFLELKPSPQTVRFDKDSVMPLSVRVIKNLNAEPEVLSNDLMVTASCLRDESPCGEFGIVIDFFADPKFYKVAKGSEDRVLAVFKVQTGAAEKGVNGTGVIDSNLKDGIKNFEDARKLVPSGEVKVEVEAAEPTEADLLKGAQAASATVSRMTMAAEDAFEAAGQAKRVGDAAKAEEQAKLAEDAAKSAEEAHVIVVEWFGKLKALPATASNSAKVAEIDARIADSAEQVKAAQGYANGARIEAGYAKSAAR